MDRLQHQGQYNSDHLRVACTKSADKCCRLLEHRDAINKVLLGAGLEIREDHRHPRCIRMALSRNTACNDLWWTLDFWHNNSSMILVRDLLIEHRCITALETYSHILCPLAVQQALRRSPALKTLTVFQLVPDCGRRKNRSDLCDLINSITSLEELTFKEARTPLWYTNLHLDGQLQVLMHLTKLDAACVWFSTDGAHQLLQALIRSNSVNDLAVNGSVLTAGPYNPGWLFAIFLTEARDTLKKLVLKDCNRNKTMSLWVMLTEALSDMAVLEELHVAFMTGHKLFNAVTAGLSTVALRCKTLRIFQLPNPGYRTPRPETNNAHWTTPWVGAVQETKTLRELWINLTGSTDAQCRSLLLAVAKNETLKKVGILDYAHDDELPALVKLIRDLGLGDRVGFSYIFVANYDKTKLQWPELPSVNFSTVEIDLCSRLALERHLAPFKLLIRRGTRLIIRLFCSVIRQPEFASWLKWLSEPSSLTAVDIEVPKHSARNPCARCRDICDRVISALASNPNIASMTLTYFTLETSHVEALCQGARDNCTLTRVTLTPYCPHNNVCGPVNCRRLSTEFRAAALKLQDIVHKNVLRFSAAVKFILGEEDIAGIRAIEDLKVHPGLVEQLQDSADLTKAEALEKVTRAVSRVLKCDISDYMWLAGVVKERQVRRLNTDAQQLHILDLPPECWLHIRQYLKIGDVTRT